MRQAGYLAAAGIFALDNNIEKLKIDNYRAKKVAKLLEKVSFIENIRPVRSNIIIFDLNKGNAEDFKILMKNNGVLCTGFGPQTIRFVFHLDISNDDFNHISSVIKKL
jgi:threonine aldolase